MVSPTPKDRRRRGFQWPFALWLTGVWVLLWGNLSVANVASGFVVAVVITAVFPLPPVAFGGSFHPIGLMRLAGRFAADLVVASAQVTGQAFRFGHQPKNALVQVDLRARSDLYMTLTAELLSLIPGTLVIEAHRSTNTLYMHVLGVRNTADVERVRASALDQEERVVRALGSAAELDAFHRAKTGTHP